MVAARDVELRPLRGAGLSDAALVPVVVRGMPRREAQGQGSELEPRLEREQSLVGLGFGIHILVLVVMCRK